MKQKLIILFITLFFQNFIGAQNFTRLTDLTGIDPSTEELSRIEKAIKEVTDIMPVQDRPLFKVYDVGFYIYDQNVASSWEDMKTKVENDPNSDYYLLFGRESTSDGLNTKIRVKLKLPNSQIYNCLTQEERDNLEKYIQKIANDKKSYRYADFEVPAIELLKEYVFKVVTCNCKTDTPECQKFSGFSYLDIQLGGLGFRKKEIKLGSNSTWVSGNQGIYDFVGKKVIIDGTEYDIADQVSEGKAIIEAQQQILPDTVINTNIHGKVYILDNESFTNGEWENAKNQALTNDYVEYWVILTGSNGKTYLYSRFTIGGSLTPVAAKGEGVTGNRNSNIPTSPWGAALKVLGNAAIDAVMQTVIIRIVDPNVNDWGQAWDKVSYLGAAWEGVSSLIPWKKDLLNSVVRAATSAFAVVLDNALRKPDYTLNQGIVDFSIGFAASGITQLIAPKVGQYGTKAFSSGLSRLDNALTNHKLKIIVKVVWNGFMKIIGNSIPLSNMLQYFNHMIGNKGLEHIFRGEIKNGAAIGVHHISAIRSGTARIIPGSIVDRGQGFYEALVEVLDANGNWILKQGKSTFFPDNWPESKVLQEISDIIGRGRERIISSNNNSTRYQGTMSNGVNVTFTRWPNFNNNILTAFPEP